VIDEGIKLFARRDDVDRINNENVAKLPSQVITYKCLDHFSWKDHHRDELSLEKNLRPGEIDGTLHALVCLITILLEIQLTQTRRKTIGTRSL
jgi:hypothetical protein